MKYECSKCKMSIEEPVCGKCGTHLELDTIETKEGKKVLVCSCPKGCGKIKSPQCCGEDMNKIN